MTLEEIHDLAVWFDARTKEQDLLAKFQALIEVLSQNTQPNRPQQPYERQRDALIQAVQSIDLTALSDDQRSILSKLSVVDDLGQTGVEQIEDILYKNAVDYATAQQKLTAIRGRIDSVLQHLNRIKSDIGAFVARKETEQYEAMLKVYFQGGASIGNIVDLKQYSETWYDIIRGIAMLHEEAPETARVVEAHEGSLVITFAVSVGIASAVSIALLNILKVIEKTLNIALEAEKIRNMKLTNKGIADQLEKEAKAERERGVDDISATIVSSAKPSVVDGEKKNAIGLSVKKLFHFVETGGDVDCYLPPQPEQSEEGESADRGNDDSRYEELIAITRSNFDAIRKIEEQIKQIEYHQSHPEETPLKEDAQASPE